MTDYGPRCFHCEIFGFSCGWWSCRDEFGLHVYFSTLICRIPWNPWWLAGWLLVRGMETTAFTRRLRLRHVSWPKSVAGSYSNLRIVPMRFCSEFIVLRRFEFAGPCSALSLASAEHLLWEPRRACRCAQQRAKSNCSRLVLLLLSTPTSALSCHISMPSLTFLSEISSSDSSWQFHFRLLCRSLGMN